ncbi:MAG: radical SAM protein [Candidatus Omnitrophica bacterium]|nr:radical SAM protein [Candidatus Omnitrophota bacterium]
MRDVLYGCWCKGKRIGGGTVPPYFLLSVATVLKKEGYDVTLVDAQAEGLHPRHFKGKMEGYDLVVANAATMTFNEDAETLRQFKLENPRLKTILFGSHGTFMPRYALTKEGVDIIVINEPEGILRELVRALDAGNGVWKDVRGIGYKENGETVLTPQADFIDNLDEYPMVDVSLLPEDVAYFNPLVVRYPYITAVTTRGCPSKCTFCTAPFFHGPNFRYQSAKRMLDEVECFLSNGYREVYYRDEIWTVHKKRNIEFCKGVIERGYKFPWICNAKVGLVDKEQMEWMKKAGCSVMKFGVESGNQHVLDRVKKGFRLEQTVQTFKWAHEAGIDTHAHIMLGMPDDTEETIERTMDFTLEIDPTTATFGICTPYPGTPLFAEVTEKYPEIKDGSQSDLTVLHTEGLFNELYTSVKKEDLAKYIRQAYRRFYLRLYYFKKRLTGIRSWTDVQKLAIAGTKVFDFSIRGE